MTAALPDTLIPHTDTWYAARRDGITGTDLPKILGLSRYGNALSVWLDKRGELPPEPAGEAALWGQVMEQPIAEQWATTTGATITPTGVHAHLTHPWMRASPDRLVDTCPDPHDGRGCYLEVKCRSAHVAGRWREDMPDDVLAQVAWTAMVLDVHHAHVAVLLGGNHLATHRYDRDPALEAYLQREATTTWRHVTDGTRPHVDADGAGLLLSILNRESGPRAGERDLDPATAAAHLQAYTDATADAKDADATKKRAATELVRLLGEGPGAAHTALIDGQVAYTYKTPATSYTLSAPNLRRLAKTDPALYDALRDGDYLTPTTPAPRLTIRHTQEQR